MNLREDAIQIWKAAVDAVDSERLVQQHIVCCGRSLRIGSDEFDLTTTRRIEVVGAGKAGAGMARGVLAALSQRTHNVKLDGWVNVPDDCVEQLDGIHLHSARPAGLNEPTLAGVDGSRQILDRIESLTERDICIVLISGGGSALLPAPVPEITLESKLAVTRLLSAAGAPIEHLNIVRIHLSSVKGGGLLRHCKAGHLISLIISDVIGDPLDIIASGPTVIADRNPQKAIAILAAYDPGRKLIPREVYAYLESQTEIPNAVDSTYSFRNHIVGSNQVAVTAAEREAVKRGYSVINLGSQNGGAASKHGEALIKQLMNIRQQAHSAPPHCIIAGGETTVELAKTDLPRRGGRNQEVVLSAIAAVPTSTTWQNLVLLSGGTDGEDGPTDAAGAFADEQIVRSAYNQGLKAADFLAINNSYPFFNAVNGLLRTGPTHTNVMDIAVGLVGLPSDD